MMLLSTDPVPAVLESEAEGEILEIFLDIKCTTGADVVNLIWRHLAITPGALQAVWKMLRPVYKSGLVLTESRRFRETLSLPKIQPLSQQALMACGERFAYVDILSNPEIRANLPTYANWPTFPQLWVDGELIGGCDIVTEMHEAGELKPIIKDAVS